MTAFERAIEYFGLTDNPYEAGYILPDGKMLDFSGKKFGGSAGAHALDHSEITHALPYAGSPVHPKCRFTRLGALRFFLHSPRYGGNLSIGASRMLTVPQLTVVAACLKHVSYLAVDVYTARGKFGVKASNSWEPPPPMHVLYQWLVKVGGLRPLEL